MSWLGQENEECLKPFVEKFVKAHEQEVLARTQKRDVERTLLSKMVELGLKEIRHGEWRIVVEISRDANFVVVRRDVVDLS